MSEDGVFRLKLTNKNVNIKIKNHLHNQWFGNHFLLPIITIKFLEISLCLLFHGNKFLCYNDPH